MKTNHLWLFLFCSVAVWPMHGVQAADLPDLNVTHIRRTPAYHCYDIIYPSGIPTIMPGTEEEKRWPDVGEMVHFTAFIINKGAVAAPACSYQWMIDGEAVAGGMLPSLEPGVKDSTSLEWPWPGWGHDITFSADVGDAIVEGCERNNQVHDRIDALGLWIFITRTAYDYFQSWPNMLGSRSAEDWVKSNIDTMNICFANAVYPLTPQGVLERVRIDRFIVYEEGGMPYPPEERRHKDGEWGFSATHMTPDYFLRTDWGFIHEVCHQLGRIDLYMIGIGPVGNKVLDEAGLPVGLGTGDKPMKHALMFDMSPFLCEHTAYSFNRDLHKRRGYYGEYLFDIPVINRIRLLDQNNQPLSGATVRAFRKEAASRQIPNVPFCTAISDADGMVSLGEKPYGDWIDVVGTNGLIFLAVSRGGHTQYDWITIIDSNMAYWRGDSLDATYDIRVTLPPAEAPKTPWNLRTIQHRNHVEVTLAWDHDDPGTRIYRIYRCPCIPTGQFYPVHPFLLADSTTEPVLQTRCDGSGFFYRVTAVNHQNIESGFSNEIMVLPWYGLRSVTISGDGQRYLSSTHYQNIFIQDIRGFNTRAFMTHHEPRSFRHFCVDRENAIYLFDNEEWNPVEHYFGLRKYAPDGSFLWKVGHRGSGPGYFSKVTDVAINAERHLFLLDQGNHCLQALQEDGAFIASYGSAGDGEGQFQSPLACTFAAGLQSLLVADSGNDRIVQLIFDGHSFSFVRHITHDSLQWPVDVAADSSGRILAATATAVLVFDPQGGLQQIISRSNDGYQYPFRDIISIAVDADNAIHVVDASLPGVVVVYASENLQPSNSLPTLHLVSDDRFRLGIAPLSGDISDAFTFRIKYTDFDDDPPMTGYPKIYLDYNGDGDCQDSVAGVAEGVFVMQAAETGSLSYRDGVLFEYQCRLPASQTIRFRCATTDGRGARAIASPPALQWRSGPLVFASQLRTDKDSFSVLLQPGQATVKTLTIHNSQTRPIPFQITAVDTLFRGQYHAHLAMTNTRTVDWLGLAPSSGTIAAADSIQITLSIHATAHAPHADLRASLVVESPDSAIYSLAIPVLVQAAHAQTNLAYQGQASAVSWPPGVWEPSYAVDDDTTTAERYWRTRFYPYTLLVGDWWQVEMNETYWINQIAIFQGLGSSVDFFRKFHVEASLSGAFLGEQVTLVTVDDWLQVSHRTGKAVLHFSPLLARYIRLVNDLMTDWVALQEVRVFYSLTTAVEDAGAAAPLRFELQPPFPNPFNSNTMIRFHLPHAAVCKLEIYNVQGELVIRLAEQTLPAGMHQFSWDGRNRHDIMASSGVYFCRLSTAAGERKITKLLLLK